MEKGKNKSSKELNFGELDQVSGGGCLDSTFADHVMGDSKYGGRSGVDKLGVIREAERRKKNAIEKDGIELNNRIADLTKQKEMLKKRAAVAGGLNFSELGYGG